MHILAELAPLDPVAGTRATLRVCSAQDRTITGLNGQGWWPAISQLPTLGMQLFDGDFSSAIDTGNASFSVQEDVLVKADANARRMLWAGATVKLYAGASGQAWPWTRVFQGIVDSFDREANKLKLTAKVDVTPFKANVLTAFYAGTGDAEGGADLKGKPKPYLAGRTLNVEPVLVDADNSVFQFHGYGPIEAVNALYERASSFGASVGDYASFALLVAAAIPAGRWGTCLAEGMIRLGAPPYGVITGDVDGDKPSGTWIRLTGAIIARICSLAGVSSGAIDSASLAALDTAVARNINVFISDQITVLDFAQRLARPCNAQAGVSWLGKLFVTRVGIGTPSLTLDAQGRRMPPVQSSIESDVSPPYARMEMGAARAWRVHSFDEIAFAAQLVDRGDYASGNTYREGNIVQNQGSSWLYINPTATSGNAPPALPTTANAYWKVMAQAGDAGPGATLIFRRSATQPATPDPSAGVPTGWYDDTDSVPGGDDPIWTSPGSRPDATSDWAWQVPKRVEGQDGANGVTVSPAALDFSINCTSNGTPKSGQFNKTITFKVVAGASDLSTDADTSYSATFAGSGWNGSLSGNVLTLTGITVDDGADLTVLVKRFGAAVATVHITGGKKLDGQAVVIGSTPLTTMPNSTSFAQIGSNVDLSIPDGGAMRVDMNAIWQATGVNSYAGQIQVSIENLTDAGAPSFSSAVAGDITATASEPASASISGHAMANSTGATKTFRARAYGKRTSGAGSGPMTGSSMQASLT